MLWEKVKDLEKEPETIEWLRSELKDYLAINWSSVSSSGVAWEALKVVIRGCIIQRASFHKRTSAQALLELKSKIKYAET